MFETRRPIKRTTEGLQLDQVEPGTFTVPHQIQLVADVLRQADKPVPFSVFKNVTSTGLLNFYQYPTDADSELYIENWYAQVGSGSYFTKIQLSRYERAGGFVQAGAYCTVCLYQSVAAATTTAGNQIKNESNYSKSGGGGFWLVPGDVLSVAITGYTSPVDFEFNALAIERKIKY